MTICDDENDFLIYFWTRKRRIIITIGKKK